ncbi:MAG: membrane protein insertion efficiency factor YidD [Desulforegulaceae bacterium]|nr:membrane protein insertion efficiency factor YidD [Desulforegulaceae bacterium]
MKIFFLNMILICLFSGCALVSTTEVNHRTYFSEITGIYRNSFESLGFVRKGRCPMYPSCSSYAEISFKKHSFFKACFLTGDRLIRCGRDSKTKLKIINTPKGLKFYDPVPD